MDFFSAQDLARKRTKWMIGLFALAVLCIGLAVHVLIVFILRVYGADEQSGVHAPISFWHPEIMLWSLGGVAVLVGTASMVKIAQLRSGGSYVARSLGGIPVAPNTTDPDERKLLNIVEEMAIASGVPMPEVFVLEESGINGFAAGYSPGDAVIAITRGCIRALDRDELQGVVAHEFSHILNGDMRLNIRIMGVLFGILVLAVIGQSFLRGSLRARLFSGSSRRNGKGSGGIVVVLLIAATVMAIGYIGVFFGRLIQSAISRQREFLADAAAVQFTRNPDGIAGALKKIGGTVSGGRIENAHSQEAAHFFFANALGSSLLGAFATHPALPKRIRAIDPNWNGQFLEPKNKKLRAQKENAPAAKTARGPLAADDFIQTIGVITAASIRQGVAIHESLQPQIDTLHQQADAAKALLPALQIVASGPHDDLDQLQSLKKAVNKTIYQEVEAWIPQLRDLDLNQRFALLDTALPMATTAGIEAIADFPQLLHTLAHTDGTVRLEELAILRTVRMYIEQKRNPSKGLRPLSPAELEAPINVLLSALVHATGSQGDEADQAFKAGARKCSRYLLKEPVMRTEDAAGFEALEAALDLFGNLPAPQKKIIFEGALAVVLANGTVSANELSLIRIIAISLALPMPPLQAV
ncbi:MAG: hypothetical protein EA353_03600 [Puniceicoccaceae bacterium]|nr:MAG: hypothetical protein EA353_03600 [Puniceicoccaceae bacterium]